MIKQLNLTTNTYHQVDRIKSPGFYMLFKANRCDISYKIKETNGNIIEMEGDKYHVYDKFIEVELRNNKINEILG